MTAALRARVRAFGAAHGITYTAALEHLAARGLDDLEARRRAGEATAAASSPAARQARASKAGTAAAASMSADARRERARKAAAARYSKRSASSGSSGTD